MPLSTEIQFYVDQELLSIESAQYLTAEQIEILSKAFTRRIITTHIIDIEYFLMDMDPEGKQQINQVGSCLESYVNNGVLTQEEVNHLELEHCFKLGHLFVRDLILSRRLTIEQVLEFDQEYLTMLDELNELITQEKLNPEQVLSFTHEQTINLGKISDLIVHDVISVDNALHYTTEQTNRLRVIYYMAKLVTSGGWIGNGADFISIALGPWHDYFDSAHGTEAVDMVRTFIADYDINDLFTGPIDTLNLQMQFSPQSSLCNLFFHNKLTLPALTTITPEQERKLNCEGVYALLLHDHLNMDQVFALTLGQCYQLDDPHTREQIIAGELALADIPEVEIVQRPPIMAINNPLYINRQQSTHTASIHRTVSESATRLFDRYNSDLDPEDLDRLIERIKSWVLELPNGNKVNEAAKRCIVRISDKNYMHTDPVSTVTTRQLLGLGWLAIHDENLRIGDLADAENQFCRGLYEIQREYNLSETGEDLGGNDSSACHDGTFNKLMEKLAGIHPDVQIEFITLETAALKFKIFIREELEQYLAKRANPMTVNSFLNFTTQLKQLKEDGIEIIWNEIKDKVAIRIFEEFHSLFDSKESSKFKDFIDAGQYFQIDELPSFHQILLQSNGYQQYCSNIIRASGIFSSLTHRNSSLTVFQENDVQEDYMNILQ